MGLYAALMAIGSRFGNFPYRRAHMVQGALASVSTTPRVLAGYAASSVISRHRLKWLFAFFLMLIAYSMLFTLIGRFQPLQFLVPIFVLLLFVIWLLPESRRAPTRAIHVLSIFYIFALLCWPDYLAFSFSGLPWITAIRLVGVPLLVIMLICLSVSREFRMNLLDTCRSVPLVWKGVLAFTAIAVLSVALSSDVGQSLNKLLLATMNWTMIFFCAVYVFRTPGRALQFGYLLWIIGVFTCLIAVQEWRYSAVPWAGHIPNFLQIEDESVKRILTGSARAATGIYRVQSKFTTPLGFAEFLTLVTPLVMYLMISSRKIIVMAAGALTLVFFFWTILNTDARLGVIGFFSSLLLTTLIWGVLRWYRNRDSLVGPAVVLGFPAAFAVFMMASLFIGRLRKMMWGSGAQQFSNDARQMQWEAGIPKILAEPWGRGIGRGASELGFTNPGGVLTIDSYYLSVGLEFGIIGFCLYFGTILASIYAAGRETVLARDRELSMIAPIGVALVNFVIIKSVLSQQENHPLAFIMLGAVVALVWRNRNVSKMTALQKLQY